jgi:DNA primase
MTAVERIRDAVDVKKLLGAYGGRNIKGTSNVRCCCPIHQGDNPTAFVFTQHNKMWFCHTGCMDGGDVFDFVMKMEECNFMSAVKKVAELFEVEVDWETEEIEENPFREEARAFIEQMLKRNNITELPAFKMPTDMKLAKVNDYRGYSPETIDWWKFRYCLEGELQDRLVIPFEDVDKRLVGITGRAMKGQPEKFMHRPRNLHTGYFLTGLGRNMKHIEECGYSVKIVEGVFDCARWYDYGYKNVCAPIGLFFTEEHILQLYKAGVTSIELGFDNDKAGRNGIRKAIKRAQGKFDIYVLVYPEGKDADDCTQEELDEVHSNRLLWWEWLEQFGEEPEK